MTQQYDEATVEAFNDQWRVFRNRQGTIEEQRSSFERFFSIFPMAVITPESRGFEVGCGTGRYAQFVAPLAGHLTLIDTSAQAIAAAKETLAGLKNCSFVNKALGNADLPTEFFDFGYSFGVLHHIPDTPKAIKDCAKLLRPGAPFLVYLYYRFDNRPGWFVTLWKASELIRRTVSALPVRLRHGVCDSLALLLYWPLAKLSWIGEKAGLKVANWPLSDFRCSTFRRMRNNARDRFGTPLEQRFTQDEIVEMMEQAGFRDIRFREGAPYWCAVGFKC